MKDLVFSDHLMARSKTPPRLCASARDLRFRMGKRLPIRTTSGEDLLQQSKALFPFIDPGDS